MRQLDLTYRRDFHLGGHIELQIHGDLDVLSSDAEFYITDLAMRALTGRSVADHVAEAVNHVGDVPDEATEPDIIHEHPADSAVIPVAGPAVEGPPFRLPPAPEGRRRIFTDDHKRQAVAYAAQVGPIRAAEQLDIHETQLRRWIARARAAAPTPPAPIPAPVEETVAGPDTAPGDDPAWPCRCSCGRRYPTVSDWRTHRRSIPQTNWKLHRLAEQPAATMVDTGIPHPKPPNRGHVPDIDIIDPHSSRASA